LSHILYAAGMSNQNKTVYIITILPLFRHVKNIILEYSTQNVTRTL